MENKFICILIIISTLSSCNNPLSEKEAVDYVNPLIGTARDGWGAMIPCVGSPFAMTNFTVQTNENIIGRTPYYYEDSSIIGFMATRQPAQWMGDYGYVSLMPQVGKLKVLPQERKVTYQHSNEIAKAYYYSVKMDPVEGKSIRTEMSASDHCGIMRFTFPKTNQARIIVQSLNIPDDSLPEWQYKLNSIDSRKKKIQAFISIEPEKNEITGYNPDRMTYDISSPLPNFKGYFIIQFSKSFSSFGTWNNDTIKPSSKELVAHKRIGAYVGFETTEGEQVYVKIATSFISIEQARKNLDREIADWDLEKVRNSTREVWQKQLSKIHIGGGTTQDKTIFYTAMFHCLLYPREISEYGRYYSGFDDQVHNGFSFTDYSTWDTYRALHPFLILNQPQLVNRMITSMLQMYQQGGRLPIWPNPGETNVMIGTHSDAIIADAIVKKLRGYDVNLAYEAMLKNAMISPDNDTIDKYPALANWTGYKGRPGLTYYKSKGYIPSDKTDESVSRTLEYAYDDFCIAQVAKELKKQNDFNFLMNRSKIYKKLFNPKTGFMAPRLLNGKWDKDSTAGFTEGSPWTYLFCVAHDIPGLIELMGGNHNFAEKLGENFSKNHYEHYNEPGHHYSYLFNYCGQPWKTQELVNNHLSTYYQDTPSGIKGNDDCGQMSAWYVFSAMGLYPVTPGSEMYAIGVPHFPKMVLKLDQNGQSIYFEIIAHNLSPKNKFGSGKFYLK